MEAKWVSNVDAPASQFKDLLPSGYFLAAPMGTDLHSSDDLQRMGLLGLWKQPGMAGNDDLTLFWRQLQTTKNRHD